METTLYDKGGHAVAYIANDGDSTIYLWNGRAVAYIYDNEKVYSWRGHHLGWFIDGIIYDKRGLRTGFLAETCPSALLAALAKMAKLAKNMKMARLAAYARPALSRGYSEEPLQAFLAQ